jgi:hypothetical protein
MYNEILRRVRETIVTVEKAIGIRYLYVCSCACVRVPGSLGMFMRVRACSLAYPACNAYAPYCDVICGPSRANIFSTLSHKWREFSEKVSEQKMCFFSFTTHFLI